MELLMHKTSRSNQLPFKVYNVKDYKFITTYTVEVEFNNGNKEIFYSIYSVEVIGSTPKKIIIIDNIDFEPYSEWYYIDNTGFIKDFIVYSNFSANSAKVLSKVHTLYSDWNEAYKALEEYNKLFKTFKE